MWEDILKRRDARQYVESLDDYDFNDVVGNEFDYVMAGIKKKYYPYYDEDRFSVPTGIVDPSYSYEVNLQMFWHAVEPGEYLVKAGTPLCQWIPIPRQWLNNNEFDVIVEDANEEDLKNNEIMDYHRYMSFPEMTTLKGRIANQKKILSLNKNKERFE